MSQSDVRYDEVGSRDVRDCAQDWLESCMVVGRSMVAGYAEEGADSAGKAKIGEDPAL